jgi:hypothetical protein
MMYEDQHEQAIEDVLHALRNPEPPQGYETRIHNALLQASQTSHRTIFSAPATNRHPEQSAAKPKDLLSSLLPQMSWATACAAIFIAGLLVHSYSHHEKPHNTPAIAHENTASAQPIIIATKTSAPTIKQPNKHTTPTRIHTTDTQPSRVEVAVQTHEYIPEPPLPLTEQERLVLRMMRRNTAQQLADYTPDARTRHLHEDAQAYNDYFADKPLDGQPIYHQQLSGGTQ